MNTDRRSEPANDTSDDLLDAVILFQTLYAQWSLEHDTARRAAASAACQDAAERVFALLEPSLEGLARRWMGSGLASDIQSMKLNLFAGIFVQLPRLRIDPERNPRALLLTVARYGVYDMYRADMDAAERRNRAVSELWSGGAAGRLRQRLLIDSVACDDGLEDALIEQLDQRRLLEAIRLFWQHALNAVDLRIVDLRLRDQPFRTIARTLGSGWTEEATRQRYHRIICRTRNHLRAIGLVEGQG
ncbi:MAG TPA: hypothetical protein VFS21_26025 [Roseiflexaceae bacterium]|nr:hypothetical protein [Roseiflexaceae bacterium]